ncbi:unnamed protein product [Urochloa humidicola]
MGQSSRLAMDQISFLIVHCPACMLCEVEPKEKAYESSSHRKILFSRDEHREEGYLKLRPWCIHVLTEKRQQLQDGGRTWEQGELLMVLIFEVTRNSVQMLAQMLSCFTKIADEFNVSVYITNQLIYDRCGGILTVL